MQNFIGQYVFEIVMANTEREESKRKPQVSSAILQGDSLESKPGQATSYPFFRKSQFLQDLGRR